METFSPTRPALRIALVGTLTAATLFGSASLAGPASADPPPQIPKGAMAANSIPAGFQMETHRMGDADYPGMEEYRPIAMTQLLLRRWSPALAVDGSFGPKTRAAVIAFQKAVGLPATGELRRADFYRLFAHRAVNYGSSGDAVKAAQLWLSRSNDDIAVDGHFGPATRTAVVAQQRAGTCRDDLEVDGIVGPLTRAASYIWECS